VWYRGIKVVPVKLNDYTLHGIKTFNLIAPEIPAFAGMSVESNFGFNPDYFFPMLMSTVIKAGSTTMSSVENSWSRLITANGVVFPYVLGSTQINSLTGHQVFTGFTYDTYGNLQEKRIRYEKGDSDVVFTTTSTFINDATNWLIGKLDTITESYEAPGETTITRTTSLTYSSDGILKPDLIKYLEGTSLYYYKDHNYNSNGNLVQLTESGTGGVGSRQTGYTYETNGIRLETITDPLGHLTTNNYDTYGRLSSQVDYLSNTTSYTYDNLGRITSETHPDGFVGTTAYTWGLTGGPTNSCYYVQQSGNDGSLSKTWYDELAREIRSDVKGFDGSFVYTVNVYNNKGQLYQVSEPSTSTSPSQWNTYTYDTYGRADYIDRPSGRDTDYAYNNNRVTETTGGKVRWKETDSQGLVTAANDAGGDITYNYYPDGQVKTITAPGSVVTSMQYDLAGNQTQLADPSAGTISYTYDAFGQVRTMINARSQTTTHDYYADGRLLTRDTPEGTTTYRYNSPKKQLINISLPGSVSRSYSYDNKGRVETITDTIPGSSPFMTTFTYDSYGRLSTRTHPSSIVETMNYNTHGYLASVSAGGATRWTITAMNARQQITAATLGNGLLIENFTYDDLDRLREVSGPQNLSTTYALNGNISAKSDIGATPSTYGEDAGPYALTGVTSSTSVIPSTPQSASYTSFDQVSTIDEGICHAAFTYDKGATVPHSLPEMRPESEFAREWGT
jgi:YD repeat-containing protein